MQTTETTRRADALPSTGCCPRFDPEPWNDKEITWHDKPFVQEHVRSLFHIPLNMGSRVLRAKAKIDAAHAEPSQQLMLSDETSPWGAELFIDVSKEVPGARMAHLSGTFLTKVFEGPYRNAPRWAQEMQQLVEGRGKRIEKLYFAYTTCPACAKAYGENYVVLFAKLAGN